MATITRGVATGAVVNRGSDSGSGSGGHGGNDSGSECVHDSMYHGKHTEYSK
jgi:hypothetical protein